MIQFFEINHDKTYANLFKSIIQTKSSKKIPEWFNKYNVPFWLSQNFSAASSVSSSSCVAFVLALSKPSLPLVATPLKMWAQARSKGNDGDLGMSRRRPAIGKFEINYILEESCVRHLDKWVWVWGESKAYSICE